MKASATAVAAQLRHMDAAAAECARQHSEEEQREAARALGIEHYLPDPQEPLPLPRAA